MAINSLFKTTVSATGPLDGSQGQGSNPPRISDFLTIESLTNFGVMTGAITAAWGGLRRLSPESFGELWVPYAFAAAFAGVSFLISLDAFKKDDSGTWV